MIARPLALSLLLSGAASTKNALRSSFETKATPDKARRLTHCDSPNPATPTVDLFSQPKPAPVVVTGGYPDQHFLFGGSGCVGQTITFTTCGLANFDTGLSVSAYDDDDTRRLSGGGNLLACNDDYCGLQSTLAFTIPDDHVYLLRVGGFGGSTGSGSVSWTEVPAACSVAQKEVAMDIKLCRCD